MQVYTKRYKEAFLNSIVTLVHIENMRNTAISVLVFKETFFTWLGGTKIQQKRDKFAQKGLTKLSYIPL